MIRGSDQALPLGKGEENGVVDTGQDWKSRIKDQSKESAKMVMGGDSSNLSVIIQQEVSLAGQMPWKTGFSHLHSQLFRVPPHPLGKDKTLRSKWLWIGIHSPSQNSKRQSLWKRGSQGDVLDSLLCSLRETDCVRFTSDVYVQTALRKKILINVSVNV